jgi:hypothetical protein
MKRTRNGGRGGIRTHGEFNPTLDFESSALNRTQPPFRLPLRLRSSLRENGNLCKRPSTRATFGNTSPLDVLGGNFWIAGRESNAAIFSVNA